LNKYKADSDQETALLLVSPAHCSKAWLNEHLLDNSQWWQNLKATVRGRAVELCVVTDVIITNRWALDYRPAGLPQEANYVVNTESNGYSSQIRQYFQFHQNSASHNAHESAQPIPYTVLARCRRVQEQNIYFGGSWSIPFKA
jgi:hypothetical protein